MRTPGPHLPCDGGAARPLESNCWPPAPVEMTVHGAVRACAPARTVLSLPLDWPHQALKSTDVAPTWDTCSITTCPAVLSRIHRGRRPRLPLHPGAWSGRHPPRCDGRDMAECRLTGHGQGSPRTSAHRMGHRPAPSCSEVSAPRRRPAWGWGGCLALRRTLSGLCSKWPFQSRPVNVPRRLQERLRRGHAGPSHDWELTSLADVFGSW